MNTNYDQVLETVSTGHDSASVRIQGTDTVICHRITDHFAEEVASRWNACPALLEALKDLLGDAPDTHEVNGRYECRHCGREWSAMCGDNEVPENCPSDDCPGFIARAAIAKATL